MPPPGKFSAGASVKKLPKCTIFYTSCPWDPNLPQADRAHTLYIDNKRNSVSNTEELIAMINGDSLTEAKQHLRSFLALVEATALAGGRNVTCRNCAALQYSRDERIHLLIYERHWSNCAGCALI